MSSGYTALIEFFRSLEAILRRTPNFTEVLVTASVSDAALKLLLELLSLLSGATKQMKQGELEPSKHTYIKTSGCLTYQERFSDELLGRHDSKAVLQRLDRLTEEESCVTVVQSLEVLYGLVNNMKMVMNGE